MSHPSCLELFGLKTMDMNEIKICSKCGLKKSRAEMSQNRWFECKDCTKKLNRQRRENRKKMGEPPKDYRCPLCGKNEEEISRGSDAKTIWNLDHDHATNKIRTWLCHNCNRGLGIFKDNVEWLKNAVLYIEKYAE